MDDIRDHIFSTIENSISDFLYYNRKEDEDLPVYAIENAISEGRITKDEILQKFCTVLNLYI